MIVPPAPHHPVSLLTIEGGFTLLAIAMAFAFPRLGAPIFSRIERAFKSLAHRKTLAVFVVGASALLLRLAMLPLCPIPQPFVHDDFSYLLAADTFAHGRLANPTPAMWMHFESVHIMMKPTYMSMYFPAPGLVLAAGQVLTGHAWFGLLLVTALMCAAVCWALQAWLPPTWALLGGFIAVLRFGLFSYWINTYTGGGSVAALGGALVIGSLPRLMRGVNLRHGILLAIGIILLATSRPYEGMLLCLPVLFVLLRWIYKGKNRPPARLLIRRATLPLLLILAAGAWMGYYNYRVNGSPLTPPYKIDRTTYAVVPYFFWQHQRPKPVYHNAVMEKFYYGTEMDSYRRIHSIPGYIKQTFFVKPLKSLLFFTGFILLPPLFMSRRVIRDRRVRFLLLSLLLLMAGDLLETGFQTQYLSPFIIAFYALGLQAMRHLRVWRPGDQPAGKTLVRLLVVFCVVLGGVRLYAQPLHIYFGKWPSEEWSNLWYGPGQFGAPRARVNAWLDHQPGKQLAIVRYTPDHNPVMEWVYNAADINSSKIIWARDLGPRQNAQLIHYYKNRTVWLIQPDKSPVAVTPYPMPARQPAAGKALPSTAANK
ncbi:MAG TPA: hypothetical protein VMU92_11875 [Acidobacteriaceae bacterium]|nr:hypothetical protein [Acidobacteriaceae bacterium]